MIALQIDTLIFVNIIVMTNWAHVIFLIFFSGLVQEKWDFLDDFVAEPIAMGLQQLQKSIKFLSPIVWISTGWRRLAKATKFVIAPV